MGRKFIILGGGESGVGAAILAKQQGYDVFLSDAGSVKPAYQQQLVEAGIEWEEGAHSEDRILAADEVMKSPGIPEKNALVKKIRQKGIAVISEIELGYRFKGDSKVVGITGSNGKTTTTSLLYHICKHAGADCALVGNIGYSFAKQVALDPKPLYVAEISSFQLDDIKTFRADIAILTNITEDHLDRYEYQFEKYINSKFRIAENQRPDDYFIYCKDDKVTMDYLNNFSIYSNLLPFSMQEELNEGGFIKNEEAIILTPGENVSMSIYDFALRGKHNQYNTLAAGIAAATLGLRKEKIKEAIESFESLEHRMEYVTTVKGVEFINDSKATNVNSTWYALESMTRPTVLILGGVDKGNDYSILEELVEQKVTGIVCLGTDNAKIHEVFAGKVKHMMDASNAKEAVQLAFSMAEKEGVVLLSPGCASFDLFKNYEDRGLQFKAAVMEL